VEFTGGSTKVEKRIYCIEVGAALGKLPLTNSFIPMSFKKKELGVVNGAESRSSTLLL
jgi:hypothetical protein